MLITLNGEARDVRDGASVTDLLTELELVNVPGVGVERNGEFVDESAWAGTTLQADDHVEVVRFLGGG